MAEAGTVAVKEILVGDGAKHKQRRIVVLTLDRPASKNALSKGLCHELTQQLRNAQLHEDLSAIVLTGSDKGGPCFSAGVDLRDPLFADAALMSPEFLYGPKNYLWQLQHCRVPLIAAVAGPCITGGMEIALNCDILIASPSAIFRDTHSTFGIVPSGGMTQLLPRMIGLQAAKWMSLFGQPVGAQQALQWGLVSEVVQDEGALTTRAVELATQAAGKNAKVNLAIKELQHDGSGVSGALRLEMDVAAKAYALMGQQGAGTKQRLSAAFANRSKM